MVTVSEQGELLRAELITPVRKEEKASGYIDIKTCVEIEWFSPLR